MVSVADPQAVSPSRSGNAARLQLSSSSSNPHVQRLLCPWLTTCGTALEAHENVTAVLYAELRQISKPPECQNTNTKDQLKDSRWSHEDSHRRVRKVFANLLHMFARAWLLAPDAR